MERSQKLLALSLSIPQFLARLSSQGLVRYLDGRFTFSQNSMRTGLLNHLAHLPEKERFYRIAAQAAQLLFDENCESRYLVMAGGFLEEIDASEEAITLYVQALQNFHEHNLSQPLVQLFHRLEALGALYTLHQKEPPSAQQFELETRSAWRHTNFRDLESLEQSLDRLKEIATRGFPAANDHARAIEAMRLTVDGSIRVATSILQEMAESTNERWLSRLIFERLSWSLELSGQFEEAAEASQKAIALTEDLPVNNSLLGWNFTSLARILGRMGRFEDAQEYLDRGLQRFEIMGSLAGLSNVANTAGELARARGDFEAAEIAYRKAVRLRELGGQFFPFVETLNLFLVRIERDSPEEIEPEAYQTLRDACVESRNEIYMIIIELIAAWRALRLQNFPEFELHWSQAHQEKSELIEPDLLMIYEKITALLHKEGRKEWAYEADENAQRLREALEK